MAVTYSGTLSMLLSTDWDMFVQYSKNMSGLRDLPVLPVPYSHGAALSHVRDYLERATDSSPYGAIDQETYMTVLKWCEQA